eukprot:gb/GECG01004698.1/.p1 GENE.gb/GECG01004698.1/~~gb/GECG01004698.1/.p1  ORF type:complete len:126 (+),score=8.00 gb/GECG01004698.1/:1-378(+)
MLAVWVAVGVAVDVVVGVGEGLGFVCVVIVKVSSVFTVDTVTSSPSLKLLKCIVWYASLLDTSRLLSAVIDSSGVIHCHTLHALSQVARHVSFDVVSVASLGSFRISGLLKASLGRLVAGVDFSK